MTTSADPVVIVGGGQAAVQLCLALRKEKVTDPILMLSEEPEYPYHRPPLSKSYLSGETDRDKLAMRPPSFYESKNVQVELNAVVSAIDTTNRKVTAGGKDYPYSALVIATGARPRELPIPGADLNGVHVLRDLHHSVKIKSELASANHVAVLGAGFIGLEFAAVANKMGKQVTVFDMADRVMERAVSPEVSAWFEATHRANGISLRLNDSVSNIVGNDKINGVQTASGDALDCDLLVIGVGVLPNMELANDAGITCDNGIVVNEYCETNVADVFAIGDCAFHPNPFYNHKMIRLESVQNATDQARTVARVIGAHKSGSDKTEKKPYNSVPWFWSDQGEHSLQMAGLSDNADQFIRRDGASDNQFSVFHFRGGHLQSVDSINSPRDHMLARKFLTERVQVTAEQAADPDFELKSLLS